MTREEFENMYFEDAIDYLMNSDAFDELFDMETAKVIIKDFIDQDNWIAADHLLHFIANESSGDYFIWDSSSGTFSEPVDVSDVDDLVDLADRYGLLEESVRRNRRSSRRMNESIDDSFADSLIGLPYDKAIKKIENAKLYLSEYGISGGGTPAPGKTEYASFKDEDETVELVIKYKLSKNKKYPNALTNGEIIDAYIY
jgi:hypothetical protein